MMSAAPSPTDGLLSGAVGISAANPRPRPPRRGSFLSFVIAQSLPSVRRRRDTDGAARGGGLVVASLGELLRGVHVRQCTTRTGVVADHGLPEARRLRDLHGSRDHVLEYGLAEVAADLVGDLVGKLRGPSYIVRTTAEMCSSAEVLGSFHAVHQLVTLSGRRTALNRMTTFGRGHGVQGQRGEAAVMIQVIDALFLEELVRDSLRRRRSRLKRLTSSISEPARSRVAGMHHRFSDSGTAAWLRPSGSLMSTS